MSELQPIETAPKDGTVILGVRKTSPKFKNLPPIAWCASMKWTTPWFNGYRPGWFHTQHADAKQYQLFPTHWTPMPT